ncbi:uncharacterized protein STEHIDRAFT_120604, partial [Stereum hirsutum FP-91666 SS1]|uniref:uncharacterized protein n=1 Tax=Stereum hirsutum (strain FP-91666) TaxID=721885 RepID=UPI00044103A0
MTLFRERLAQSLVLAGGAAFSGWTLMKLIPHSMLSFTLTQTSVAFLAIASLMVFIIAHHRRSGDLLDQRQEELTLIAAFGFLFFAML